MQWSFELTPWLVSLERQKTIEPYDSPEYQATLALLKDFAERDVRII